LGAAIIHPDVREVIPLMPEPIVKQDGTAKNDCERNAAKRFLVTLRQDRPHLQFIVTEDSLSSNAPHIEALHAHDLHYILGVKEGDHAYLFQQVQAAEHSGRVTSYERHVMRDTTMLPGWCIGFALSMTCLSMSRTRQYGSISLSIGKWGLTASSTLVG
jgi:hypothetical protein